MNHFYSEQHVNPLRMHSVERESLEGGVMESFGAVGLPCILVLVVIWTPFIETLYFTIWKLIKGSNYWRPSN